MRDLIPYIATSLLLFCSCSELEVVDRPLMDGRDATVGLKIDANGVWESSTSRSYGLTPGEEKQIKSLEVLIFNSAQNLVSRHRISPMASPTNTIDTKSGSGMSIYVIANTNLIVNASNEPNDVLGRATTVAALKSIKVSNLLMDVGANKTLLMYGMAENITITAATLNTVTIPLNYVACKVTVNLYSALPVGESFELSDWKLGSLARYSYLFPRATDVGLVANDADFATQSTGNSWSDGVIDVGGFAVPVKTTTFYVFENRQGVTLNTDPRLKSGPTAPARATHILARGYYKTLSGVKGIDLKVMLGANSINDYNVERKSQYTYNIKVTSFTDFTVETRYKDAGVGFQAEIVNTTLDAHYDFRPVKVGSYGGTSTIVILDENDLPAPASFWLKLSNRDITKFVLSGGNYIRPTFDPTTEMLQALTYLHAPPTSMSFKMFYLYADEFLTDNGLRVAKVVISNDQGGTGALPLVSYTITQRGALVAGKVGLRAINALGQQTNKDYVLATEIYEEATMAITPGNLANERTSTMQWGFSGIIMLPYSDYTRRHGYDNTSALVLSNVGSGTLRTPYGRTGNTTITHQSYDPIFNTYAARYCFEKNRDVNGDGVIKGAEIKWYLPSPDEQLLIYAANGAWSADVADRWTGSNVYLSSVQYSGTESMASRLSTGLIGATPNNSPLYVRCVRQL